MRFPREPSTDGDRDLADALRWHARLEPCAAVAGPAEAGPHDCMARDDPADAYLWHARLETTVAGPA